MEDIHRLLVGISLSCVGVKKSGEGLPSVGKPGGRSFGSSECRRVANNSGSLAGSRALLRLYLLSWLGAGYPVVFVDSKSSYRGWFPLILDVTFYFFSSPFPLTRLAYHIILKSEAELRCLPLLVVAVHGSGVLGVGSII